MNGPIVIVPKYGKLGQGFSRLERLKAAEHPGRRTTIKGYQSPASWIADLISLKKFITLCSFCQHKFNPRKHGYRKFNYMSTTTNDVTFAVNGKCDGCKQETALAGGGMGYVSEQYYKQICVDPAEARRKARMAWRGMESVWTAIQKARKRGK